METSSQSAILLDPNLAALVILAIVVMVSLVVCYCATVVKDPRFMADFAKSVGKAADTLVCLFKRG